MTRALLAFATALTVLVATAVTASAAFPSRIELPDGFRPEGITIQGDQFFVGSIPTGDVYRGSLVTGEGSRIVQGHTNRAAIGMKVDRGRLFVAGGPTGDAWVYDADSGATLASYELAAPGPTFVNDVVVTKDAAWFTDSMQAVLYRVPLGPNGEPGSPAQTIPLTGDFVQQPGFNTNGIDATPNGRTLVIVQSSTGKLFTVTPTGLTDEIGLANGESVPNGDGILLDGKTLYVVQNQLNQVAVIELSPDLGSGTVVRRIGNADLEPPTVFDVPTTSPSTAAASTP